jgi:hypothetical protein
MSPFNFLVSICQHYFRVEVTLVEDGALVRGIVSIVSILCEKLSRKIHIKNTVQVGPRGALPTALDAFRKVFRVGVFREFSDLHGQGGICAKGELKTPLGPKVKIWPTQQNTNIVMGHVEKAEGLLDAVTADVSVLTGLLWAVREVERAKVFEKNVATHGKALV